MGPQGSVTPPNQDKHVLLQIIRKDKVQLSQNNIIKEVNVPQESFSHENGTFNILLIFLREKSLEGPET